MTLRAVLVPLGIAALAWALAAPGSALAQRRRRREGRSVRVEVVDVAGPRVYLEPGEAGGVVRGTEVTVGGHTWTIVAATGSWAAFDRAEGEGTGIEVGAGGRATTAVAEGEERRAVRLDSPREMSAFVEQWPDPVLPAASQTPTPVPLGRTGGERRIDLVLSTSGSAVVPLGAGEAIGHAEARARIHAAPIDGVPFWIAGDVAGQLWFADDLDARAFGPSRPPLRVRELAVSYGRASETSEVYAAIGRLRYAAMQLGALDGVAIRSPSLEGVTVGAFGGFVPDPRLGVPDFETQRFGLELAYRDARSELRPSIGVVAHGSMFRGTLDERRLNVVAQFFPDVGRLGAHAELSLHDAVNPWAVSEVELSAAGIDGGVRIDAFDVGARFDVRRPERSLWLASFLPATWLCIPAAQPAGAPAPEPCSGIDDARLAGSVDLGVRVGSWALRAGGNVVHYVADAALAQGGGYVSVRAAPLFETLRADLVVSGSSGALYDTLGGRLTLGWAIVPDVVDVSAHYRLGYGIYRAALDGWLEHMAGGTVVVTPMPELSVTLSGDGIAGRDVDVVVVRAGAIYRPAL